jgi:Uma2 family endonuclease
VSYITNERLHIVRGHIHGAPDLVVEFLSDRTAARDLGIKSERYLQNGVREYWLPDPRDRSLRVRYAADRRWEEHAGPELESRLLPGLMVRAERIFRSTPAGTADHRAHQAGLP